MSKNTVISIVSDYDAKVQHLTSGSKFYWGINGGISIENNCIG